MYCLEDEPPLKFKLLYAMDGNDSLKRIHRKLVTPDGLPGESRELATATKLSCSRYLSREFVNEFGANKDIHSISSDEVLRTEHVIYPY